MDEMKQELECPGCHRRYKRSDIKTDRLICPACGREVVALVTVGGVDNERVIRAYFYPKSDTFAYVLCITGGLLLIGFIYCAVIKFSWALFAVLSVLGLGALSHVFSGFRRRKIFKMFARADFDLEKGLEAHRKYVESLSEFVSLEDEIGKDLEKNLRARFAAAKEVQTSYAVGPAGVPAVDRKQDVLRVDLPPGECPNCHAPYKIADYSGQHVICRRCGGLVEIRNAVNDAEILGLVKKYLARQIKEDTVTRSRELGICLMFFVVSGVFWYFSDTTASFLRSWAVLPMYFAIFIGMASVVAEGERRRRRVLLGRADITLFDFEYFLKRSYSTGNDDRRLFDQFKGELLDLFKSKGTVMKGDILS